MSENKDNSIGEEKSKLLIGLVISDGKFKIEVDKDASLMDLMMFWGILSSEIPFKLQHMKVLEIQKNKSGVIVPGEN